MKCCSLGDNMADCGLEKQHDRISIIIYFSLIPDFVEVVPFWNMLTFPRINIIYQKQLFELKQSYDIVVT